jgi:hypothetical protein
LNSVVEGCGHLGEGARTVLMPLASGIDLRRLRSRIQGYPPVDGGKVQLAAGVTADSTAKVKAGELVNFVAQQVGGKGGGKPDLAMAGGTDAAALLCAAPPRARRQPVPSSCGLPGADTLAAVITALCASPLSLSTPICIFMPK